MIKLKYTLDQFARKASKAGMLVNIDKETGIGRATTDEYTIYAECKRHNSNCVSEYQVLFNGSKGIVNKLLYSNEQIDLELKLVKFFLKN